MKRMMRAACLVAAITIGGASPAWSGSSDSGSAGNFYGTAVLDTSQVVRGE